MHSDLHKGLFIQVIFLTNNSQVLVGLTLHESKASDLEGGWKPKALSTCIGPAGTGSVSVTSSFHGAILFFLVQIIPTFLYFFKEIGSQRSGSHDKDLFGGFFHAFCNGDTTTRIMCNGEIFKYVCNGISRSI